MASDPAVTFFFLEAGGGMIRFLRIWLVPLLCAVLAFLAGFVAFHQTWNKGAPLTDGSAVSFHRAAEKIEEEHLLQRASSQERVEWLLEICRQPNGLARDHALYEAIQQMQPGDFLRSLADLPALGREMVAMNNEVRQALIEASMERWLEIDREGALRSLVLVRSIVESGAVKLPEMGFADLGAAYAVLAAREPEWMREQIGMLGTKTHRETAIRILMSSEAQRHPQRARAWLETFRGSKEWRERFSSYITGLSLSDPVAAMEMAIAEDRAGTQDREGTFVSNIFFSTATRSPTVASELLLKLEPELRKQWLPMAVFFCQPEWD